MKSEGRDHLTVLFRYLPADKRRITARTSDASPLSDLFARMQFRLSEKRVESLRTPLATLSFQ